MCNKSLEREWDSGKVYKGCTVDILIMHCVGTREDLMHYDKYARSYFFPR